MFGKTYDEADRQYFSGFIDQREKMRPAECCGGLDCWVEFGPPAMTRRKGNVGDSFCVGCGGKPAFHLLPAGSNANRR